MTAVYTADLPCNTPEPVSGLSATATASETWNNRRVLIFIQGVSAGTGQAEDISEWVKDLVDIEGLVYASCGDKESQTNPTWSTVTLTYANHVAPGNQEVCLIGRIT